MAKLVRARPKLPEFLPEWAKCCQKALDAISSMPEVTVDLERTSILSNPKCIFCRSSQGDKHRGVWDGEYYVQLDLLDLDETGVPDGNYVTFAAAEQP